MNNDSTDKKDRYEKVAVRFWDNVGLVLKEKHVTWKELAEKLNTDPRSLSARKTNHCNPSLANVIDIARSLNVSVDYLLYADIAPSDFVRTAQN